MLGFMCMTLHAQDSVFDLPSASFEDALKKLSSENKLVFAYPSEMISNVSVDQAAFSYSNIDDLLDQLLASTGFEYYKYDSSKYLIRKKHELAENSIELSSRIIDSETGNALPLATIYLEDYSYGVFSDEDGYFKLELDGQNQQDILISYLGYETYRTTFSNLKKTSSIKLQQSPFTLDAPVIEYIVPPLLPTRSGALKGDISEFGITASASGIYGRDLMRYLQLVSGVAAYEDDSSDLKIRGSSSEATRVIMDGMPLYNVSHYYGIFSAINSNYIQSLELYKNAQPIEYEGLSGGMVIFDSGNSVNENIVDINLLTASTSLSLPITDLSRLKVAARSSYRNVNDTRLLDLKRRENENFNLQSSNNTLVSNQPLFKFYDLNAAFEYSKEKTYMKFNFFRSGDALENNFDLSINLPNQQIDRQLFSNKESWYNKAAGAHIQHKLGKSSKIQLYAYVSNYSFESVLNSEIRNENGIDFISNRNANELTEQGIKAYMNHNWASRNILYGAEWKHIDLNQRLTAEDERVLIDYGDRLSYTSLFASFTETIGKLDLNLSVRIPISDIDRETNILFSPHAQLNYIASERLSLKSSVSKTNQILREVDYENRLGQNQSFFRLATQMNIPVLESWTYMLGFETRISNWSLDVEAWYKNMDGSLLVSTDQPGFQPLAGPPKIQDYKIFKGRRRSMGVDFTVAYISKKYSSWLAYTLSKTEDKYPQVFKARYFASQEDRRHQFKWTNQYDQGPFTFSLNGVFNTGRPYLALENIDPNTNRGGQDHKNVLRMLPDYFRLDIAAAYNFNISDSTLASFGVSVYNLTNRQNLKYLQYAYRFDTMIQGVPRNIVFGNESELLGRSLNLEFRLQF